MSLFVMARIRRLTRRQIGLAEIHARRLDAKSRSRTVREEPPVTWVPQGVDLNPLALPKLYDRHVAGAFVPNGKSKAMHMLVLFPDDVKTDTRADAEVALRLAVEFAQELFGGNAVFAARMDRDEKSLTNADLFIAPRYIKKTKHTEKEAISLSRHLKLAAEAQRGALPTDGTVLKIQGQALQDAWANYLRQRGYQAIRGQAKTTVGPDWVSPEAYGVSVDRKIAEADREVAAQDRAEVVGDLAERQRGLVEGLKKAAEAAQMMRDEGAAEGRQLEAQGHDAAAIIRAQAEDEAAKLVAERQARAEREAQAIRDGAVIDATTIRADAAREQELAAKKAKVKTADAEAKLREAEQTIADAQTTKRRADDQLARAEYAMVEANTAGRQLELLARALTSEELKLKEDGGPRGFTMNEAAMNIDETQAYRAPWVDSLRAVARAVARASAHVLYRGLALIQREKQVVKAEATLMSKQSRLDADRSSISRALQVADEFTSAFAAVPEAERSPLASRAATKAGLLAQAAALAAHREPSTPKRCGDPGIKAQAAALASGPPTVLRGRG